MKCVLSLLTRAALKLACLLKFHDVTENIDLSGSFVLGNAINS